MNSRSAYAAMFLALTVSQGKGPKVNYEELRPESDPIEPVRNPPQVGRNEPCPCGSGKKFKKCHLNNPIDLVNALGKLVVATTGRSSGAPIILDGETRARALKE